MALLTATEAKAIKPDLSGSAQDTLIDTLIGRADEYLAAHCGYPVYDSSTVPSLTEQTYTQYLNGPTWEDAKVLAVPFFPLGTVTSVHDDPERTYGASSLVASTDYETDAYSGLIILKEASTFGYWSRGLRRQKVITAAGWATVPTLLKHAGAELVWHWYRLARERGHNNTTINGAGGSSWSADVPDFVLDMVKQYRLPSALL